MNFNSSRDNVDVTFKKSSRKSHYCLKNKWSYRSRNCKIRQSLRGGTLMESSNLLFMIWYKVIFLLTTNKKGFSSKEIQRQLGLRRYYLLCSMVHKLRKAMCSHYDRYTLEVMIEMDEGYFTVEASESSHKIQKAGRGSKTKCHVMIMMESTVLENI